MNENKVNELVDLMFSFDSKELEKETDLLKEYKKLKEQNKKYKEIIDKIKEIVNEAPCLWYVDEEFERVDGSIDLSYKEYIGWKDILELLEEIE